MLNDNINKYLQVLKNKEYSIKKKIEEIEKRKSLISEIQDKIKTIEYSRIPTYQIGIWNDDLTRKIVTYETCVYDTEEKIIDVNGDYEYLTDISSDVLVKALRDSKERYLCEIKEIEKSIEAEINI